MCGVLGVYAPGRDVARLSYFGLLALQHRGQESAGIAVSDGARITALREMGLVAEAFSEEKLRGLRGQAAVGHCRYSTTGSARWANAQPLVQHGGARTVALAHNGNLTNAAELRAELARGAIRLSSTSDTEAIAALVAHDGRPLAEAVAGAMPRLEGAFSAALLAEGKLLGFRDPHGIRPLVLGRLPGPEEPRDAPPDPLDRESHHPPPDPLDRGYVIASETCALDLLGADFVREVEPGELIVVDEGGVRSREAAEAGERALCIFELIYFARPDSKLRGVELHRARVRMGERLAREAPAEADVVIPVPDSGTPSAIGYARASGIPYSEGLIKSRYVGRTFIQPEQTLRELGIKTKFNPLSEVAGKRLVVVDDSIVRGSTTRKIVAMLFDAGALEVHVRISSPPVVSPCFYGVDMATERELIAGSGGVAHVRTLIGATSLAYLSLAGLEAATRRPGRTFCRACLTGSYPTRVAGRDARDKLRFEPAVQ
ncbi:MAG: amidophosphoribosyltransferase [Actinomycetota bacterium]|nr:amidophosphoribosyltransferase [Actinomycetota bacterium]